jgi:glyoxylase-like metal-dependent hydrolase (beta-lactamase superfamily II)
MSVLIQAFTFNGFQENTFVVSLGQDAVIFDPGCYTREEEATLFSYINENALEVRAILFTHAHIDHILGASFCLDRFKAPAYLHAADQLTWESVKRYANVYGFENYKETEAPTQQLTNQLETQKNQLDLSIGILVPIGTHIGSSIVKHQISLHVFGISSDLLKTLSFSDVLLNRNASWN